MKQHKIKVGYPSVVQSILRKKLLYENERWVFDNTIPFRFFFFKHIMDCGYVPLRPI